MVQVDGGNPKDFLETDFGLFLVSFKSVLGSIWGYFGAMLRLLCVNVCGYAMFRWPNIGLGVPL